MRLRWPLLLIATLLGADPAGAEESANPGVAAAHSVEKANAAVQLYQAGKWDEALVLFREADQLYHSPVFVLYAARCLRGSGALLSARREYGLLLAEQFEPTAPASWTEAQVDGRAELAVLQDEIPSVLVTVLGGSPTTRLSVDDRPLVPDRSEELDPGEHTFVARDGARRAEKTVSLHPRDRSHRILLSFPALTPRPTPKPQPERRPLERGPNVPGLAVTGVGGAALLAGGVVGAFALAKAARTRSELPSSCDGATCPSSQRGSIEPDADRARTLAKISDVLFVSGAILVTGGIVMLLTGTGAPSPSARAPVTGLVF